MTAVTYNLAKLFQMKFSPVVKTSPSSEGRAGPIPDWGAKIPHALRAKNQNIKQKQYCNKFNKEFKNRPQEKKSLKKPVH